jgi:translation initiation factor IF-3
VTHPERGTAILDRLAEELSELGVVEQRPMQEGRNMTMMMAPSKAVLAGRVDVAESSDGEVRPGAHVGDVASAAIDSPAGSNGTGRDADQDEGHPGAEAEPVSDDAPTAVSEPAREAEPNGEAEPTAQLEPPAEAEPSAEAEPAGELDPPAKARAASD